MLTSKDAEFIQYLMRETEAGKIRWEPTAQTSEFASSLKGKYKIVLKRAGSSEYMSLRDANDQLLLSVGSEDYGPVSDLFGLARRVALDVDSAIDEILRG
jgi:hypothetical protein